MLFETGPAAAITAIEPVKDHPAMRTIKVAGRTAGRLSARSVEAMGLAVGQGWTAELAARVAEAEEFEHCLRRASRWIDRRAMSRAEVARKLAALPEPPTPAVRERVLERMEQLTLLDDAALGRALIEELRGKGKAGPALLRAKLLARGIDETLAEQLVEATAETGDPLEPARAAARKKTASLAHLPGPVAARRLAGMLARRGFSEDVVQRVIEEILGDVTDPGTAD